MLVMVRVDYYAACEVIVRCPSIRIGSNLRVGVAGRYNDRFTPSETSRNSSS